MTIVNTLKTLAHSITRQNDEPRQENKAKTPFSCTLNGCFTVNKSTGTKVKFSRGNLYYSGKTFRLEARQCDFRTWTGKASCIDGILKHFEGTPFRHCGLFYWNKKASVAMSYLYNDTSETTNDVFFTEDPEFTVEELTGWRTLSADEWRNLLGLEGATSPRDNASSLWAWTTVSDVQGLAILPDGSDANPNDMTTEEALAVNDAVFLPAAGYRYAAELKDVGANGNYWTSSPRKACEDSAFFLGFSSDEVEISSSLCYLGYSVRLVR